MTARDMPDIAIGGLHHVTAIASDPRTNAFFYTRVLGQRLVKKTVNFDDPGTYHLYYGDEAGSPGSIMTFFPWPDARRGRAGAGQATTTSYAIPAGSIAGWIERLRRHRVEVEEPAERFGELAVRFSDPDGLRLELVETEGVGDQPAWRGSAEDPVPVEQAIRGFRGVTLSEAPGAGTREFLTKAMGFEELATEDNVTRFRIAGSSTPLAGLVDVAPQLRVRQFRCRKRFITSPSALQPTRPSSSGVLTFSIVAPRCRR